MRSPESCHGVITGGGGGVVRARVISRLGGVIPTAGTVIPRARTIIPTARSAIASVRSAIPSVWGSIPGVRSPIASIRSAIATAYSSAIRCSPAAMTRHSPQDVVQKRDAKQRLEHEAQQKQDDGGGDKVHCDIVPGKVDPRRLLHLIKTILILQEVPKPVYRNVHG